MKFLRDHWYHLAAVGFLALAFYMGFWGGRQLPWTQIFMIMLLMALLAHQTEEYILPGGAPLVINEGVYGEKINYRHFPGNTQSSLIVNVLAWGIYILGIVLHQTIWLGLGISLFTLVQLPGHAFQMNKAMKTWYNPGMATAVCLLTPISISYMIYVTRAGLVCGWDWLGGFAVFVASMLVSIILPVQLLKSPDSPYEIPDRQVEDYQKVKEFASFNK